MATWDDEFSTPGTSARVWLELEVVVVSQNIATNQTTLNWYLRGEERITNASPYNLSGISSGAASVNGSVFSSSTLNYDYRASFATNNIASGTRVVTHTADGTKTISVSASFNSNDSILGTASISDTLVLPTIPRATVPSVSPTSGDTGATYTITHDPASASFYHDVAYGFDGEGGSFTDITTNLVGTDTSTDWTPGHTLLPDSTSGTATIRVITRSSSGGTIIGTEYVDLPLTVPTSVKPTVSSVAWADSQVSSPDMPTLMGGSGRYVQRWSKLTPTVTAAGSGGSTISSIAVTQNGQTTPSGTPFANAIALSGSVPFSVVATDSRGRVNDAYASTVSVTAYNYPSLPTPTVTRTSDAGGTTPSPTGTYLRITPNASVSSLNFSGEKNLLEYQIRTRPAGGSWTTNQAWTATGVSGTTWTANYILSGFASSTEYEVEVSIRDLFGKNSYDTANTVKTLVVIVPSEAVDIDWNQGLGFGFGAYHTGTGAFVQVTGGLEVDDIESGTVEATTITQGGNAVVDVTDVATTSAAGIVELATDAEAVTGTDTARAVTPSGLTAALDPYNEGYRLVDTVYFTASDTFDKVDYAPWLRAVRVYAQGGGGAGGGRTGSANSAGVGGSGGGCGEAFITDIAGMASSVTVTVGAGGNGVSGGTGGSGGTSSFGAYCTGLGGTGGAATTSGVAGTAGGDWTGDTGVRGGPGGAALSPSFSGGGGSSRFGGGGVQRVAGATGAGSAAPATSYGAGGGGGFGSPSAAGGDAADGIVVVEVYA